MFKFSKVNGERDKPLSHSIPEFGPIVVKVEKFNYSDDGVARQVVKR